MNTSETIATILLAIGTFGAIGLGIYLRIKSRFLHTEHDEIVRLLEIRKRIQAKADIIMSTYQLQHPPTKKPSPKKKAERGEDKILETHGAWNNYCIQ